MKLSSIASAIRNLIFKAPNGNKEKPHDEVDPAKQWARICMNQSTSAMVFKLEFSKYKALEISGRRWENFGFNSYVSASYPEFDICRDVFPEKFDIIISEQVFEHVPFPHRAARNIYNMLNSGGYFLITTPFLIKYHPVPDDYFRWTENGIKLFLSECGFPIENIKSASWGNKECLIANLEAWASYDKDIHSLENQPEYPLVVWALARK
ncbi:MAG: methyltransferase domain-containing protein [Syntrophobacteraceae bacterium]